MTKTGRELTVIVKINLAQFFWLTLYNCITILKHSAASVQYASTQQWEPYWEITDTPLRKSLQCIHQLQWNADRDTGRMNICLQHITDCQIYAHKNNSLDVFISSFDLPVPSPVPLPLPSVPAASGLARNGTLLLLGQATVQHTSTVTCIMLYDLHTVWELRVTG